MTDLTNEKFWNSRWKDIVTTREILLSTREMDQMIARMLSKIPKNGKLLELGVAPGRMAQRYNSLREDLTIDGVDISEEGIRQTLTIYNRHLINGKLYTMDFRDKTTLGKCYDAVVSHGLIEHFDDYCSIVQNHFKFIKPNGIVLITVPNYSNKLVLWFLKTFSHETLTTHNISCMNLKELSHTVEEAGGQIISTGKFGGPILPHSVINPGISGIIYKKFCQCWNLLISMLGLLSKDILVPRFWESHYYIVATKKRISPHDT